MSPREFNAGSRTGAKVKLSENAKAKAARAGRKREGCKLSIPGPRESQP